MHRRDILKGVTALGCSLAAHPLTTTMTFASVPGDARFVVIVLRGGMDGLGVLHPMNDPNLARMRPVLLRENAGDPLTDGFALHSALDPLRTLWAAGELAFAPAVSTPYRGQRSHFDGQDMLEAGTGIDVAPDALRGGWLNRMLSGLPGAESETAFAIGHEVPLILTGQNAISSWSPETRLDLTPQARLLLEHIYAGDPVFHAAASNAIDLAESLGVSTQIDSLGEQQMMMGEALEDTRSAAGPAKLAEFAANRLREETRIASFSLTGWDTHRNQLGGLRTALDRLGQAILTLRDGLGPVWEKTTVLAMTEFGRTVAENGNRGTDHGTGGTMLMAGGALRGGQLYGTWPGVAEVDLLERRDLQPTDDVRRFAAWALRGSFGFDRAFLEQTVFPGVDLGEDPNLLRV